MSTDSLFSLEGKVALVTGGATGIGRMIAEGLAARGVRTYIAGRKAARLEEVAAVSGCIAVPADIATAEGRATLIEALSGEDRLDLLVNNAGAAHAAPIDRTEPSQFDRILQVNLTAPFALVGALLPLLRAAASHDDPARVINISSIDAIRIPVWESYAYGASKAGLAHLTRHLAQRLADDRITVNAIAPGIFPSQMTGFLFDESHPHHEKPQSVPLGRVGQAEDIVGTIVYLASRAGAYVTGALLPVAGGLATADPPHA